MTRNACKFVWAGTIGGRRARRGEQPTSPNCDAVLANELRPVTTPVNKSCEQKRRTQSIYGPDAKHNCDRPLDE
jgi:hypothetical protein